MCSCGMLSHPFPPLSLPVHELSYAPAGVSTVPVALVLAGQGLRVSHGHRPLAEALGSFAQPLTALALRPAMACWGHLRTELWLSCFFSTGYNGGSKLANLKILCGDFRPVF